MSFYDPNREGAKSIFIYTLSTCGHCLQVKKFFDELGAKYDFLEADLLNDPQQQAALGEISNYNPAQTFPTTVSRGKVVVGFLEEDLRQLAVKAGAKV